MTAVTIPTGIPPTSRATRSAPASRLAPINAESGRTSRVFGSDDEPDDVRDDEPDEADQAGDRHGGRRDQAGQAEQDRPLAPDVDSEVGGRLLAEQEAVERPRPEQDRDRRGEDDRGRQPELEPGRALEPAEQVEEDLAQVRPRQVHRHRQTGRQQRADGVAGQEQARERRERPGPAEPVDDGDGQDRPDEREELDEPELEHDDPDRQEHADRRPERRARRGSEHVGIGQRVAQDPLERRPGNGQPEPHDHRRQDPGQSDVDDDRLGRGRPGPADVESEQPVGEDRHCLGRRDPDAAQADSKDQHDEQRDDPSDEQHPGPRPRALQPARADQRRAEDLAPGGHRRQ